MAWKSTSRYSPHIPTVAVTLLIVICMTHFMSQGPYVPPVDPVSLQPDAPTPLKYKPEDSIKESRESNSKPPTIYYPPDLEPTLGKWLMAQQPTLMTSFRALVKQDLEPDHPEVITHARKMLLPPSRHWTIKLDLGAWATPQSRAALEILKNKKKGFFVECGALNGERASNTIHMEHTMGWTGLLIEMDPYFFLQLIAHNRKSHSINACLSPQRKITTMSFREALGGLGKIAESGGHPVPCFPLETLLRAINVTKVDFLSLDVEGQEVPILKTIPFDKLDITVLAVETRHGRGGQDVYDTFMETQGYTVYSRIDFTDVKAGLFVEDTIYVKKSYMSENGIRPITKNTTT